VNRSAALIFAAALAGGCALEAQGANPLIAEQKAAYTNVRNNLLKAAEKMPEDAYSFKPTPEVQSFGERIAHIANQIRTCSSITGEAKQSDANSKTAKADLVAALKASFDACDAAWDSMNDTTAADMIDARGGKRSKLGVLVGNTIHDTELYGYLAVYMRLKGVVPPSSDRGPR
jgi:uncharacterized damage-inducible protein DinB